MFSLLFDRNFFIGVFVVLIVVFLIWMMYKHPSFRLASAVIASIVIVGLTAYCCVNINIYYSASGGIFGKVSNLFSSSVAVDETSIKLENIELVQDLDTDTYYCKITDNQIFKFDSEKTYTVLVNDTPCQTSSVSSRLVQAEYHYQFRDVDYSILCDDVLSINISCNSNNTFYYVFTENGTESVKFWNYYFRNNNFVITLVENDFKNDNEINIETDNISDFLNEYYICKSQEYIQTLTDDSVDFLYVDENVAFAISNENSKNGAGNVLYQLTLPASANVETSKGLTEALKSATLTTTAKVAGKVLGSKYSSALEVFENKFCKDNNVENAKMFVFDTVKTLEGDGNFSVDPNYFMVINNGQEVRVVDNNVKVIAEIGEKVGDLTAVAILGNYVTNESYLVERNVPIETSYTENEVYRLGI